MIQGIHSWKTLWKTLQLTVWVLLLLVVCLFSIENTQAIEKPSTEVNVYSHRHYDADQKIFAEFTKETGIRVNVVKASADELLKRLEIEGRDTQADLLITVDSGRLYRATEKKLLRRVRSQVLNQNIPKVFRDPKRYWYALTIRARVIVYHPNKVRPSQLSTYEDLMNPKWKGQILIRSSGNIYNQSLLASILEIHGEKKAEEWARGIVENMARKPKGNDRDQAKALYAGVGSIAILNTYYLGRMIHSSDPLEQEVGKGLRVFFPNQKDRGAHVNISGAGITRHSKNPKNALKLLEFLSSKKAQKVFASANYEYPIHPDVPWNSTASSWGKFKMDTENLSKLGKNNRNAVKIFDRVRWK